MSVSDENKDEGLHSTFIPIHETEDDDNEADLKYGAESVMALIVPVTLCMGLVVAAVQAVPYVSEMRNGSSPYAVQSESANQSNSERFSNAVENALIIIGVVVGMTVLLVVLYIYKCYKIITAWLVLSTMGLLFLISLSFVILIFEQYDVAMDWITLCFMIWNFGAVGVMAIYWKSPLRMRQLYLVLCSALLALTLLERLPLWTSWTLLGLIAVYDLIAVLCPFGPLRILVETAQEREEPFMPALVYSSTMVWNITMADDNNIRRKSGSKSSNSIRDSTDGLIRPSVPDMEMAVSTFSEASEPDRNRLSDSQSTGSNMLRQPLATVNQEEAENEGVKLGLGDFVFYSLLVGQASSSKDWSTIVACFIAILVGLCLTLLLLSVFRKALPALPISIAFGLLFYFVSTFVLVPYCNQLGYYQIFV